MAAVVVAISGGFNARQSSDRSCRYSTWTRKQMKNLQSAAIQTKFLSS